jgi:Molybdopterin oxidoreductase
VLVTRALNDLWFHSDTIYRAFLTLTTLTGCQGVNGGGWAHYVGQEKLRPVTGWQSLAFALDWARPPRQMIQTAYWYLRTDQWRYDQTTLDGFASPLGTGRFAGRAPADVLAASARMGWMPSHPAFNRNPLDLADEAAAAGKEPGQFVVDELRAGRLRFAGEDPDAPENWPRVLTMWRANLLGSSEGQRVLPQAPARRRLQPPRTGVTAAGAADLDRVSDLHLPAAQLQLIVDKAGAGHRLDRRRHQLTELTDPGRQRGQPAGVRRRRRHQHRRAHRVHDMHIQASPAQIQPNVQHEDRASFHHTCRLSPQA